MNKNRLSKGEVQQALINARTTVEELKKSTNPQSREIYFKAQGRVQAFEAVLDAMNGEPMFMHIYGRKEL